MLGLLVLTYTTKEVTAGLAKAGYIVVGRNNLALNLFNQQAVGALKHLLIIQLQQ
jgi:hypothetical protein